MALDLTVTYPAQVDTTDPTGYPYGKPQNASSPGSGNGTPLEERLVRDLVGFRQALLVAAGITPSGTPDAADASQYLEALETIFRTRLAANTREPVAARYGIVATQPLDPVTFASQFADTGFTLEDTNRAIRLPSRGLYHCDFGFRATGASTSEALILRGVLRVGGSTIISAGDMRRTDDPTHAVGVHAGVDFECTDTDDLLTLDISQSTGAAPEIPNVANLHWLSVARLRSYEDDTP